MEQLTFALAAPAPPTFANYVTAGNAEAVTMLGRVVMPTWRETCVVLWGAPGGGKTHLLRAAVAHAEGSLPATYYAAPDAVSDELPAERSLIAVDDVDRAGPGAQGRLFTLFNALAANGGCLIAAASVPPARMPLRDDLRSRLGWGLVFEIVALADTDKVAALGAYARSLGLELAPDVIGYLLAHGRRDMSSLVTTIAALDRHSLATKRAVTVPLLREWLQRELPDVASSGSEPRHPPK